MKYDFWNHGINPILGYKMENRNTIAQRRAYNERKKKKQWEQIQMNLKEK